MNRLMERTGRHIAVSSIQLAVAAAALGIIFGILGSVFDHHGPRSLAVWLGGIGFWATLAWTAGVFATNRRQAMVVSWLVFFTSVVAYYCFEAWRIGIGLGPELNIGQPWVLLSFPAGVIGGLTGYYAKNTASWLGGICRAVPGAVAVSESIFVIKYHDSFFTVVLMILTAVVVTQLTPWRRNRIVLASGIALGVCTYWLLLPVVIPLVLKKVGIG